MAVHREATSKAGEKNRRIAPADEPLPEPLGCLPRGSIYRLDHDSTAFRMPRSGWARAASQAPRRQANRSGWAFEAVGWEPRKIDQLTAFPQSFGAIQPWNWARRHRVQLRERCPTRGLAAALLAILMTESLWTPMTWEGEQRQTAFETEVRQRLHQ